MRNGSLRAVLLVIAATASALRAQTLAPGFMDALVASVPVPTAIAFLPDGRILTASQTGVVRIVANGQLMPDPVLTIPPAAICSNSERGLLGITVDPQFAQNGYVYVFYTYRLPGRDCGSGSASNPVNRVSRFVMDATQARINPGSETVLLDNIPSFAGNHNAGGLKFGADGMLLVSTGDGGCYYSSGGGCASANRAAREPHTLLGKILRIDRSGNIPPGNNQHVSGVRCNHGNASPGLTCLETWASGFRNPFRFAVDSETGDVMVHDVGQSTWEEIDLLVPGADYGWNVREGFCETDSTSSCTQTELTGAFRNPVFAYRRDIPLPGTQTSGCGSIAGGTFIPSNTWHKGWDGYYFADYVCGAIFQLVNPELPGSARELAVGLGVGSVVSLESGPYGNTTALYYTTYARGGELRRIVGFTPASAASYRRTVLAPDSLASLFGAGLTDSSISIRDSTGVTRMTEISYTSDTQLNFLVPSDVSLGVATVIVRFKSGATLSAPAIIEHSSPAIFTANSSGKGVPAATAVRVTGATQQPVEVFNCPNGAGSCVPTAIDLSQGDVYLSLYGSGIRRAASTQVTGNGTPLEVLYAGPQSQYPGLDQINVRLPSALIRAGVVSVLVTTTSVSNPVTVIIR